MFSPFRLEHEHYEEKEGTWLEHEYYEEKEGTWLEQEYYEEKKNLILYGSVFSNILF